MCLRIDILIISSSNKLTTNIDIDIKQTNKQKNRPTNKANENEKKIMTNISQWQTCFSLHKFIISKLNKKKQSKN